MIAIEESTTITIIMSSGPREPQAEAPPTAVFCWLTIVRCSYIQY